MKYYTVKSSKKNVDSVLEKYKGHVIDWDFDEDGNVRYMVDINPKEVNKHEVGATGEKHKIHR